jgi:serine/threonine protein phosphatase PrpC
MGGGHEFLNTYFYLPVKQNQDNFFAVSDAELRIIGVFDGHGEFGHLVSGYA